MCSEISRRLAAVLLCTGFSIFPVVVSAQKPTTAQAQELLRTRPDLVALLRQKIMTSGLTPDQIRARLQAEGYPPDLLDAYLPGSSTNPDSSMSSNVYSAVIALGIADSSDISGGRNDSLAAKTPDSLVAQFRRADTLFGRGRADSTDSISRLGPQPNDSIFGLDMFRRGTTQFDPNQAGPVDPSYRLGPGDRLVLVLTGGVEASYELEVTREGFIVIPQVGQIDVANLTLGQLDDVLYTRLGRVYSGIRRGQGASTHFSISPARLRSNQVFVVGDVTQAGSYRVSGAATVLTALYAAGGPTDVGSMRRVEVRRNGKSAGTLDVYDYLLRGDASRDIRLENGDVVFVPTRGARVHLKGEVLRPAVYEMKPGETLDDLISDAGGFTARAGRRRIQIERILPPQQRTHAGRDRVVIDVTSDASVEGDALGVPVEAGDVITVFPVTDRVRNRVNVTGNVWNPGNVGFTPGMTVSQALRLAGGVKPDAYLGEILVSRLRSDSTRVQLRTALRDSTGGVTNDFPLLEDDQIQVFSVTEFRPTRYVAIVGAVRAIGRYPYHEGMTLRDLVLMAGGLKEGAYLQSAEIARLPDDRAGGKLAVTTSVPLDSTYIFERSADGRFLGPPGLPAPRSSAPEVQLRPYDNVLILMQPDWTMQRMVVLAGEVKFPGTYALTSKGERLSDILTRAGGLTDVAYADGVVFFRKRNHLGRIGVDLPRVLRDSRDRDNLMLQDGDSIYLPQYSAVVNVQGAVNSPVAVAYVPGANLDYYVSAAGGFSRKADPGASYVLQPNGKVESIHHHLLFPNSQPKPRAGSIVQVPEKDPNDRHDYVAALGTSAQVLASLVAMVVIIVKH